MSLALYNVWADHDHIDYSSLQLVKVRCFSEVESHMIQRLGFLVFTQEALVQFPVLRVQTLQVLLSVFIKQ